MQKVFIVVMLLLFGAFQVNGSAGFEDLNTPDAHTKFLKSALAEARRDIVIISPQISIYRLEDGGGDSIAYHIGQAIRRDVTVVVLTDDTLDFDKAQGKIRYNAQRGRDLLVELGAKLEIAKRIHTKNVIVDRNCFASGSFNWLGAVTNAESPYCRLETSCVRRGEDLSQVIDEFKLALFHIPVLRENLQNIEGLKLDAEYNIEDAIFLYNRYYADGVYGHLVSAILCNHIGCSNSIKVNLIILSLLESTINTEALLPCAMDLLQFVESRKEHLRVVEYVCRHSPERAREIAKGLLTYSVESGEYDKFDMMYATLRRLNMGDIGDQLEEIIIFGAPPKR